MIEINKVFNQDCLEGMKLLPSGCIDLVLTDPPYGISELHWDKKINLNTFWKEIRRITKNNSAIIMTATQPYATDIINEARDIFRYDLIWEKTMPVGGANANRMPLRTHENILIFYNKLPKFFPQFQKGNKYTKKRPAGFTEGSVYGHFKRSYKSENPGLRYPTSIIKFSNGNNKVEHPTQKPLDLCEYLIKTYSNKGDLILDPFSGSGTILLAALKNERNFIGFEIVEKYVTLSEKRIKPWIEQKRLV